MRIFVALDIDEAIRQKFSVFQAGLRGFARDARWVRPDSLHVTLKFIGERTLEEVVRTKQALSSVRAQEVAMSFRGFGFFPTPKAARVFWMGIESDQRLPDLAKAVDDAAATSGIPKEEHAFTPHLTLARGGRGSGNPRREAHDSHNSDFRKLQEKLSVISPREFGTMAAREFFLYESQLSRSGPHYTKLASFALAPAEHHP
jgi:2'-5' RNA ligase